MQRDLWDKFSDSADFRNDSEFYIDFEPLDDESYGEKYYDKDYLEALKTFRETFELQDMDGITARVCW